MEINIILLEVYMNFNLIPDEIRWKYDLYERNHALAILSSDFPVEYNEILQVLSNFTLTKDDIVTPGGRKSPVASKLDNAFYNLGWKETLTDINTTVNSIIYDTPTHKIDCCKSRIGLEIEWNNKDPFFDRDLSNFRLLHEFDALSVGVIITRADSLQGIFNDLGKGTSYGASTTHFGKLKPRIDGRCAGGCPILVFSINPNCYQP